MTPQITETTVWTRHEDDAFCRAIPTIVRSRAGTLLAFSEARHSGDVTIDENRMYDEIPSSVTMKRSRDGGATWSESTIIECAYGTECWSQATGVVDETSDTIFVFYVLNQGAVAEQNVQRFSRVFTRSSSNDGETWSARREITDVLNCSAENELGPCTESSEGYPADHLGRAFHMCCGHGVWHPMPPRGRLIVPFWSRRAVSHPPSQRRYGLKPIFSDDGGETWKVLAQFGLSHYLTEHRFASFNDGSLYVNARSDHPQHWEARFISRSVDGGTSWDVPEADLGFPPSFRCDAGVACTGDTIALSKGNAREERADMSVYISNDRGESWDDMITVSRGPAYYSDLVAVSGGGFGVLYTKGRLNRYRGADIVFARIERSPVSSASSQVVT